MNHRLLGYVDSKRSAQVAAVGFLLALLPATKPCDPADPADNWFCWPPAAGGFNPQFFPTLQSVQALFGRPFTAASFLLHVLPINLIAARSAFIDGEAHTLTLLVL